MLGDDKLDGETGDMNQAEVVGNVDASCKETGDTPEKPAAGHAGAGAPEGSDGIATWHEVVGWYVYDWANSPFYQVVDTLMKVLLKRLAEIAAVKGNFPTNVMSAGSYPAVVMWCTAALQTVCLLSFAPFGDYGHKRKQLLRQLTFLGSGIVLLTIFCFSADFWWFAGIIRVLAGVCHNLSGVYYTSYLPLLASSHYALQGLVGAERARREVELADEMSAKGFGLGYAGGSLMQAVSFLILFLFEGDSGSEFSRLFLLCVCIALVGLWWSSFSLYSFRHLKVRPGPPFPEGSTVLFGWRQTWQTLCMVLTYPDTLIFMVSYFLWSDALNTIVNVAVLMLDDTSEKGSSVMFSSMLGTVAGLLGVGVFMKVQQCCGLSNKAMLMSQLTVSSVVSLAAGCGLVTAMDGFGFYFVLGPIMLMTGTLQANARSLYSSLSPVGKEVAMFGFYTITDKGSSLIGAGVIGVVHTSTGSYDGVFWYTMIAFLLSTISLYFVDVIRGMRKAGKCEGDVGESSGAPP